MWRNVGVMGYNFLYKGQTQQGMPGPASNLVGLLGLQLPDNSDVTQEQ